MAQPERPMNWEEARARIDRGETGDKVASDDPAAAPLGTDAEAGGVSTPPEHVRRSFEEEGAIERTRASRRAGTGSAAPFVALLIVLGLGVLLAIAVVVL